MARHRKKHKHEEHGEHPDERWLVTYADLMTLLVALFMVLFSISSVNKSKFETLQATLQDAFSGRILPGGKSIKEAGGTDNIASPSVNAPNTNLRPYLGGKESDAKRDAAATAKAAGTEEKAFEAIKKKVDDMAKKQGLDGKISTRVTEDGLEIRVLTDDLLFDSGSATPRPAALPLLGAVAKVLATQPDHPLTIEGHTDDVPIHSSTFVDNLSLSSARAESIFRVFQSDGLDPARMTAAGRSSYDSVATNTTAAGRSLNRRVEILVPRTLGISPAAARAAQAKVTIPSIKPDLAAAATGAAAASAPSSASGAAAPSSTSSSPSTSSSR
jgi:chemotaxis protein MotB